jgi:hypothetical protein
VTAVEEPGVDESGEHARAPEPLDQLGIPMSREPVLDDVRSDGVDHRRLAIGCSLLVSVLLIAFWLVRGVLMR